MADTKVTALTANTTPADADILYLVDDPGGTPASQKITVTNLMTRAPYVIVNSFTGLSIADATTYYFSTWTSLGSTAVTSAGATFRRTYIPRAGILKSAYIFTQNAVTATAETSTLYFRLNNTTDVTLSSAVVFNAAACVVSVTGLSTTLVVGDYYELKLVSATFATNPTNTDVQVMLVIQ